MKTFTKRLREAIEMSEKTQTEIANEIGIAKQCISDFKIGKTYPSIQTLKLLCKTLDASADYLLGLEDESGRKTYANNNYNNFNNCNNFGNINFNNK